MQRFTELKVWQRAHALVAGDLPDQHELPAGGAVRGELAVARAITSVPTNIAKGDLGYLSPAA
jgi:hypothetical protein